MLTGILPTLAFALVFLRALSINAIPGAVKPSVSNVFSSRTLQDVNLRFVTDSGVCETTPGVHQMSGYIDVGTNMSMVRATQRVAMRALIPFSGSGFSSRVIILRQHHLHSGTFSPVGTLMLDVNHPQAEWRSGMLVYDWSLPG